MRRFTEVTPVEANTSAFQTRLNHFWSLIENDDDLDWRVEFSGVVSLHVTEEVLTRVLTEHYRLAEEYFGAKNEHNPEERRYEWTNFPEDLIGLYSIEGIYNKNQSYVGGTRTYFFEQGY